MTPKRFAAIKEYLDYGGYIESSTLRNDLRDCLIAYREAQKWITELQDANVDLIAREAQAINEKQQAEVAYDRLYKMIKQLRAAVVKLQVVT